ncbi:MAG: HAMP domain-containing protein [Bacteroidetes bacterium]|nr:MAG: HAMP domain-containing protein [Bacteroidota bacterium]
MRTFGLYYILIIGFVLSVALSLGFSSIENREYDKRELGEKVQQTFENRERQAKELLKKVYSQFRKKEGEVFKDADWVKSMNQLYEHTGEVVLISRADSVMFVSHNALPVSHYALPTYNSGVFLLPNGWYSVYSKKFEDYQVWVFSLIKKEYRYKNKFLQNDFQSDFQIPDFLEISYDAAVDGFSVYHTSDDYAFSLVVPDRDSLGYIWPLARNLSIFFALFSLVLLLVCIYKFAAKIHEIGYQLSAAVFLFFALLLIRYIIFYFHIPGVLFDTEFFSALHYASSYWLPSLGDLFLNVVFVNVLVFFVFHKISVSRIFSIKNLLVSFFIHLILLSVLAIAAFAVIEVIKGLVINSKLNLNVRFIFSPDIYHVIGFLIITGIFIFFYFLNLSIASFLRKNIVSKYFRVVTVCATILIIAATSLIIPDNYFLLWVFIFSTSAFSLFYHFSDEKSFSLARILMFFFVYSLLSTYGLYLFNKEKELSHRQNVALRIASEQDPIAEFLFSQMEPYLYDDDFLNQLVLEDPYNEDRIAEYLKSYYFTDFWAKYDIQITTCAPGEILYFKPFDEEFVCDNFFADYIYYFGKQGFSERFFYLDNNTGRNSYLAVIPVSDGARPEPAYHLYIEFESRFIPKELGFPELLVDEKIDISRNLGNYSYAIYKNGMMTHKYGSYFFSINVQSYGQNEETFVFFDADGYSHLLYNRDPDTKIIVSKPRETMLERIAPFSYLFIISLVMSLVIWLLYQYYNDKPLFSFNYKKRLQFMVIGIVLVSVVAIGSASAWFIFNIYKNKNEAFINEKAHSILIEMENHLLEEPVLDISYQEYLNQLLLPLSHVFFTDINIFSSDGSLLASSRPKVFQEGLIAPLIHPVAYNNLLIRGKSLFIHNEKIGNLEYISAYVPLRNIRGELIAYINLPYFAQQSELRNEISYFLVAFINIYLLLLLLSVIIAFFVSNHVTQPLQVIRDSISRLSIGKINEKIDWNRNDEIGQLIGEYNRMIDELAISADLLARSERESAWREMAKQVAHEIKNPLTPMRLNVQYLQRAWKDKVDDYDERLERFTKTMVEQIDNLSLIAGEFSDFAKMPASKNETIDIREFIPEVIDLYKGFDKLDMRLDLPSEGQNLMIYADRKQLLRVFNNLIKNAIQAYSKEETAKVIIKVNVEGNYCKITLKDFGNGIADDLKQNIFQPYFTTKTGGMGLGLAMVKSIIQSFNGHISFESQMDEGTKFIIRIPRFLSEQTTDTNLPDENPVD